MPPPLPLFRAGATILAAALTLSAAAETFAQTPEERVWDMDFTPAAQEERSPFWTAHAAFFDALCRQNAEAYARFSTLAEKVETHDAQRAMWKTAVAALKGEKWTAFWAFRDLYKKSLVAAQNGQTRYLGLCMAALSTVPSGYRTVLDIFGFEYDLQKGIELLESDRDDFLPLERQAMLFYCHKNLTRNFDKAARALQGLENYAVGRYVAVSFAMDVLKDPRRAQELLSRPTRGFPYLDYQAGRAALYRGDYSEAVEKFNAFAGVCKGVYHADARFKAGLAALCAGWDAKAHFAAATNDAAVFDEDRYAQKQARRYLSEPPAPDEIRLLKARLFFDGGYLQAALDELKDVKATGDEATTELHYRKGRIYQAMGKYDHALHHYSVAQRQFPERNLWMKVYSGFHMGQIYDERGQKEEARAEWRRCLQYDGYDYQNGLEQKVKAALGK